MDIFRVDSKYATAITATVFSVAAILALIGAALLIYVHVKKDKVTTQPLTPEDEAKLKTKKNWGIALLVIGAVGALGAGIVMYMRYQSRKVQTALSDSSVVV